MAGIAFVKINSTTYRIDRPSKKAVGWLMEVAWSGGRSRQRWVACVGNHRSKPLPLEEAKQVAKELLNKPKAQPRLLDARAAHTDRVFRRRQRAYPSVPP